MKILIDEMDDGWDEKQVSNLKKRKNTSANKLHKEDP